MKGFDETRNFGKTNKENKKNKTNDKTNKSSSVFVFEVRQWMICPRQLFFKNRQQLKQEENDGTHFSLLYKADPIRYFEKEMIRDVCFDLPALVLESVDKDDTDFINKTKLKAEIENVIEESKKCFLFFEQNSIEKMQDSEEMEYKKMICEEMEYKKMKCEETNNEEMKNEEMEYKKMKNEEMKCEEMQNEKMKGYAKIKEIEEAALRAKLYAEEIIDNLSKTIETYGFEILESAADPFLEEKLFYFSKIDLYGSPQKVIVEDEKLTPYFIRITKPPKNGVWESDRITAAAYSIILENEFGKQAISENAVIDYSGDFRVLRIRYADKKKVFKTVRKIKDIKNGKMPNEKNIRLCEKCLFKEMCRPKAKTLFSRIFGDKG